ncbi:MAG: YcxB family protein [Lachnospiraceae bacterium]|nr:YcxB family protein [Lachnospiraceae bacterium]
MELEFDVRMTKNALYDYMLYHTYTGFSGILGTMVGIFLIVAFVMKGSPLYLIAGLIIILYLPGALFLRSTQQYLNNPAFKEPFHYLVNDEGITVTQKELSETIPWDGMVKAVSTPGSIVIYTSKVNASIFPKKDLGEKKAAFIQAVSTHMNPSSVKIRGW